MRVILITIIGIMLLVTPAIAKRHPAGIQIKHITERKVMHHPHRATAHRNKNRPHRVAHKRPVRSITETNIDRPIRSEALSDNSVPEEKFSILSDYAYSEVPPAEKPADLVKRSLDCFPEGSVRSEIKLISGLLGIDVGLMDAFARIESDFNPRERTGSYVGLFQLSKHEFSRYGPTDGNILDARDNTVAAALKIEYEANLFKLDTRHIPSNADLYLIHQQGLQGAAQHLAKPDRLAWKSMCATDEGKQRGEHWCRKAIWGNTLPAFKSIWKSVENFTSGAFVRMWADRVATFLGKGTVTTTTVDHPKQGVEKHEQKREAHNRTDKTHESRLRHVRYRNHMVHHHLRHYAGAA